MPSMPVAKKAIIGVIVTVILAVYTVYEVILMFITGASVLAGALTGNPADIATLSIMAAQAFTPTPIAGYACIDPNALTSGQQGNIPDNMEWPEAVAFGSSSQPILASSLLTAGFLSSNGKPDFVSETGEYGIYGLVDPGSGTNYGITTKDALNPALATNYVLPKFQNALNVVNPNLWSSNPAAAAAAVARAALQPDQAYSTTAIQTAWTKTVTELNKLKIPTDFNAPTSTEPAVNAILSRNPVFFEATKTVSGGDPNLQLALIMGPGLEDNWTNLASNSDGAYGLFRIQHPAGAPINGPAVHPNITVSQAEDPVYALNYVLPMYKAAMDPTNQQRSVSFPSSLWTSNPELAAEYTVYNAERPAAIYHDSYGQSKVDNIYHTSVSIMQALGASTQFVDTNCMSTLTPSAQIGLTAGFAGSQRAAVINAAESLLGTPYSWGGGHSAYGPTYGLCAGGAASNDCHIAGVDCSGLTRFAFHAVGINIGDSAANQWQTTKIHEVPMAQAQPGDLLFSTGADGSPSAPGHVAIYIGGGKAIMAPQSGDVVKITDITTPFWRGEFVGITDPFQN